MKTAEIISLHPGKQHNLEQIEQLATYQNSVKHITSFAVSNETINRLKFLPDGVLSEMKKRSASKEVTQHIHTMPWYELVYKFKRFSGQHISYDFFKNRNAFFQKSFLKKYNPSKIFIGFDTSSSLIFEKWKGKSTLILDLTIAIPQYKKKLAEEYNLSQSVIDKLTKGDDVWYDVYKKELELADYILCGSEFVKDSCLYLGKKEEQLKVIPYGANLSRFVPAITPEQRSEEPLKLAFIGNVSYRKGADVLLRAWEKIVQKYKNVELHFFGNLEIDLKGFSQKQVFFHGFITQDKLIEHLSKCHISILPTFFEGSSYAIYQSMAMGLAVITTKNCGSIVKNSENGLIIKYGSEDQIETAISQLIEDRKYRIQLADKAMVDIKNYTWNSYGVRLNQFISNL